MKAGASPVASMLSRTCVPAVALIQVCSLANPVHEKNANQCSDGHFLKARSLNSTLSTSHHSSLTGVDASIDPSVLFASEATCILGPDVTQGPYCKPSTSLVENQI
jgi:hypothetical protein